MIEHKLKTDGIVVPLCAAGSMSWGSFKPVCVHWFPAQTVSFSVVCDPASWKAGAEIVVLPAHRSVQ